MKPDSIEHLTKFFLDYLFWGFKVFLWLIKHSNT